MTEKGTLASLAQGYVILAATWKDMPRHSESKLICECPLSDGILLFSFIGNRLVAEMRCIDGDLEQIIDQWVSYEMTRRVYTTAVIEVGWKCGKFTIFDLTIKYFPRSSKPDKIILKQPETAAAIEDRSAPSVLQKPDLDQKPISKSIALRQLAAIIHEAAIFGAGRLPAAPSASDE